MGSDEEVTSFLICNASADGPPRTLTDTPNETFMVLNYATLCGVIGVFGIVTNIITISVILKQGINNTMSISFVGLAISDICNVVCLLLVIVIFNPFEDITSSHNVFNWLYLTVDWPRGCFADVTIMITAYITGERCLCVIAPLKMRNLITPWRSVLVLCVIYILMIISLIPEYLEFNIDRNQTNASEITIGIRTSLQAVTSLLFAVFGIGSFMAVIVFTSVLVWKLKVASDWRQRSQSATDSSRILTVRDKRTIKMIVLMACTLVLCYTPSIAITILEFVEPKFYVVGPFSEMFFILWSIACVCEVFDSSINIFYYYKMSSRFRESFHQLFRKCMCHGLPSWQVAKLQLKRKPDCSE